MGRSSWGQVGIGASPTMGGSIESKVVLTWRHSDCERLLSQLWQEVLFQVFYCGIVGEDGYSASSLLGWLTLAIRARFSGLEMRMKWRSTLPFKGVGNVLGSCRDEQGLW